MSCIYAEVILPLPLDGAFTYLVPDEFEVVPGSRVIIPFGKKKIYTGIVNSIHQTYSEGYQPKTIIDVLDSSPIVNDHQLKFYKWIADYYMCTIGEVVNAALPAALKLTSETFVSINKEVIYEGEDLGFQEVELLGILEKSELSVKAVGEIFSLKSPQKLIKKLSEKGLIDLFEKVKDKYHPKKVKKIRLADNWATESNLEQLLNSLDAKPKQQDVLLSYLKSVPVLEGKSANRSGMLKSELLLEDISPSSVKTLTEKGIFEEWEEIISRFGTITKPISDSFQLSDGQQEALDKIRSGFNSNNTLLFQGVTGSGKTEIYIKLIQEYIKEGKQVLYLLPEIALTTQIIARLQKIFGESFGVYHSRFSDNERVEVWRKIQQNEFQFVVGVRSAIFLPFNELGLVIVDEEHEPSYKQYEPAPRYHARDASIYLASLHNAKILLGTATPSLESYKNALDGKYGLVKLAERYGTAYEPKLVRIDTIREKKKKMLKGNFSNLLLDKIEEVLKKNEQAIVFQNRRGYASYISCENCGSVPKCPNCAVSLTYHQFNGKLICHYCGYNQPMHSDCLHCGSKELKQIGFGTEELEEELKLLFPQAIIQRMDLDTTRSKNSYQRIIESFEQGEIDILVGTQMISKGLDFDRVNLVGILDCDRLIHFPNFRSHERAYHLITQVSGRAGRKSQNGEVVIQTTDPDQALLTKLGENNYPIFYQWELLERERFFYPPVTRLITIIFKHRDKQISFQAANFYYHEIIRELKNQRIIGPVEPLIGKIRTLYLHEITLKLDKQGINLPLIKDYLKNVLKMMKSMPPFKGVGVVFDVDPV